ncbi:hypothetical protein ACFT2C_04130 [Promicromonospora sp. NPDC057138]|uniref:hypothetical protein n=1 Tax=Promicromonospora sp. NPDC057138 TaxID=3346031 RepID=UPI00363D7AF2
MRFSKQFGVAHTPTSAWFDPLLDQDTPLYVDPFLVFDDRDPHWADARQEVVDFFDTAAQLVEQSGGNRGSLAYRKAISLLTFPEPNEFCLGLSMGTPRGSGTGKKVARMMVEVLDLARQHGHVADLASIVGFNLFAGGIGLDHISDILCNILKHRFITYTQQEATELEIPMNRVKVKHPGWEKQRARWSPNAKILLPESPEGGGVLLAPERFLKEIPVATPEDFWKWAETDDAELLRQDFAYEIAQGLNLTERRELARRFARRHPDKAAEYIRLVDQMPHLPYDVEIDPKGLVYWREIGEATGKQDPMSVSELPGSKGEFPQFVETLASRFKHAVEHTDLWRALWAGNNPQKENVIQAIAGAMWTEACRTADVDISQEVNRGRGPVDFKFSKGWQDRALLEVKVIRSSRFFQGAETQLPQYLKTEQLDHGVYLCVGHYDEDFAEPRIKRVKETIAQIEHDKRRRIKLVLVDARKETKTSASKQ